ncbi:MAG TPA: tRNA (adenosine(37)-N6)-dimethylallyltransferase MiaA [Candidatus Acidoferrales bacterium]|nr:tRNA (adenosine(37)-N6)-dimethylallyltransferase MiaA [Candidatus Acidoferrales bacterium]
MAERMINERTVVAIVGPTCSGKTRIGIELAKLINGEIISADARQIFKLIDIGTAKPTREELSKVPHHLVDVFPLDKEISAGAYAELAGKIAAEIFSRNRAPIIVGGSGLYIRALVDGLFDAPKIEPKVKEELRERLHSEGAKELLDELKRIDPDAAQGLLPQNYKRVVRALEVYYSSGKRISELRKTRPSVVNFNAIQFGIQLDRKLLYQRIERRVDEMVGRGLVHEVKEILRRGFDPKLNSLQTVGYKEAINHLKGKISFEEMISLIKMNTRRYAKRQMTWLKKDKRIVWIEADNKDPKQIAEEICSHASENGFVKNRIGAGLKKDCN